MTEDATPAKVRLTDGLGPLPDAAMVETNPYGEPGTLDWYDAEQMLAYAAAAVAAERERWIAAVSWALGTNGEFREQGKMEGRYWWRSELAERAGLRWDGTKWVDAGPNV